MSRMGPHGSEAMAACARSPRGCDTALADERPHALCPLPGRRRGAGAGRRDSGLPMRPSCGGLIREILAGPAATSS